MSLSAEILLERLRYKASLRKWRGLAILAIVIAGIIVVPKKNVMIEGDYVARIKIDNIIQQNTDRDEILDEIANNKRIKAVVVHVNSPGGTVVGGEVLYQKIAAIQKNKPVVAVMGTMATSAAYMAVLPAAHLFAHQGTITGSIGVLLQTGEFTELAQKMGVKLEIVKSGSLKGVPSPLEKFTPQGTQMLKNVIDDFFDVFVTMVAQSRNLPKETVIKLADGRIFSGRQAVENKLIDAIGTETDALNWLNEQAPALKITKLPIRDVKLYKPESQWKELLTAMAIGSFVPESFKIKGLISLWQASPLP